MKSEYDQTVPVVLHRLAHVFGRVVKQHRLEIPRKFGTGYCAGFVFNAHIRMLVLNYELKENLVIENPEKDVAAGMVLFKLQNVIPGPQTVSANNQPTAAPSVLVVTSSVHTDAVIPIHSNTATINIEVDAGYLKSLLNASAQSPVLQSLVQNTQPLLFDQAMYPSLQKIVDEMMAEPVEETFRLFFLRVKAEELICRLLMELEKRDETPVYALNARDIAHIYRVKAQMLEQLDTPPVIAELAVAAGMSPTKLKRVFKQIFGNSIFSYYQAFRMKEAARLLKEEQLSVSEAGYQLGFSNLSHFSRVFEQHTGVKPKRYSTNAR